jgi:hypothetical protein
MNPNLQQIDQRLTELDLELRQTIAQANSMIGQILGRIAELQRIRQEILTATTHTPTQPHESPSQSAPTAPAVCSTGIGIPSKSHP